MANPTRPWLKKFLASEIREALSTAKERAEDADAQYQPDLQRFSDDGSVFRNEVVAADSAWPESYVQARQVLSVQPLRMLLSDGVNTVIASFDKKAVRPYEEDIDEEIKPGRKGDILRLDLYTVLTTTFGPRDEHIRIHVRALTYIHTQPKLMGNPAPLCEEDEIVTQLDRIARLRRSSSMLDVSVTGDAAQDGSTDIAYQQAAKPAPPSAAAIQTPQVATENVATQIEHIQTQMPSTLVQNPRRFTPMSLGSDGIEIQAGVNLAEPRNGGLPKVIRPPNPDLLRLINKVAPPPGDTRPAVEEPSLECSGERHTVKAHVDHQRLTPTVLSEPEGIPSTQQATAGQAVSASPTVQVSTKPDQGEQMLSVFTVPSYGKHEARRNLMLDLLTKRRSYAGYDWGEAQEERLQSKQSWPAAYPVLHSSPNIPAKLLVAANRAGPHVMKPAAIKTPPHDVEDKQVSASSTEPQEPVQRAIGDSTEPDPPVPRSMDSKTVAMQLDSESDSDSDDDIPWSSSPPQKPEDVLPPESSQLQTIVESAARRSVAVPARQEMNASEQHHYDRTQHMRAGQRKKWLRETYGLTGAPAFSPEDACKRYRSTFANDQPSAEEMRAEYLLTIAATWGQGQDVGRVSKAGDHSPLQPDHNSSSDARVVGLISPPRHASPAAQSQSRKRKRSIDMQVSAVSSPMRMHSQAAVSSAHRRMESDRACPETTGDGTLGHDEQTHEAVQAAVRSPQRVSTPGEVLVENSGERKKQDEDELYDTSQPVVPVPATAAKAERRTYVAEGSSQTSPLLEKGIVRSEATDRPSTATQHPTWADSWLRVSRMKRTKHRAKHALRHIDRNSHALLWEIP